MPCRRWMPWTVLMLAAVPGCQLAELVGYFVAPRHTTQKVPAEFDGLKSKTVAVLICAGPELQADYQAVQLELGEALSTQLQQHVPGVRVVPYRRVLRFQDENLAWESMRRHRLAQSLAADYVLQVSLIKFDTREPGSSSLARADLWAQAVLYSAVPDAAGRDAPAWRGDQINILHPPTGPLTGPNDEMKVRLEAENMLADLLAKKFYRHEVPAP